MRPHCIWEYCFDDERGTNLSSLFILIIILPNDIARNFAFLSSNYSCCIAYSTENVLKTTRTYSSFVRVVHKLCF